MKIVFLSTRDARIARTTDSGQLEFSRLLIASSTVIIASGWSFCRSLTPAARDPTLAHQPLSCLPYGTLTEITQAIPSHNPSPFDTAHLHLQRIQPLAPTLTAST